ncbi:MAG: hypothetical protein IKY43_01400 [Bacteroidales bacterium]|nr:hypothetical protein [Bacteroidales bacterium]
MKRIFLLLMIAVVMLSCQRNEVESTYTTAAKEIYKKYALRENLTVALIGEYKGYNAVMLQAHTDEEWEFICKEFDIDPEKKNETASDTKEKKVDDMDTLQFEGLGDLLKIIIETALDSVEEEVKALAKEENDTSIYSNFDAKRKEIKDKMAKDQLFGEDKQQRLCSYNVETRIIWVYYYNSLTELNRISKDMLDTASKGDKFEQTITL